MELNILNGFSTPETRMAGMRQQDEITGFKGFGEKPIKPVKQKRTSSRLYCLYLANVAKKLDFDELGNIEDDAIN